MASSLVGLLRRHQSALLGRCLRSGQLHSSKALQLIAAEPHAATRTEPGSGVGVLVATVGSTLSGGRGSAVFPRGSMEGNSRLVSSGGGVVAGLKPLSLLAGGQIGSTSPSGDWPSSPVGFERDWPPKQGHEVVIAMGGNIGDRVGNFKMGLRLLRQAGVVIHRHACLYETAPAYLTEQPQFLNSAIQAHTVLSPQELLDLLKKVEKYVGRDFGTVRNGPRPLDLDILFYGTQQHLENGTPHGTLSTPELTEVNTETLEIPHPRIAERPFVLAPLMDLLGEEGMRTEWWATSGVFEGDLRWFWQGLGGESLVGSEDMSRVIPLSTLSPGQPQGTSPAEASPEGASSSTAGRAHNFWEKLGSQGPSTLGQPMRGGGSTSKAGPSSRRLLAVGQGQRPLVMGILNVTPDSFSDGGQFTQVEAAVARAEEMVTEGVDIIDIGGQSTSNALFGMLLPQRDLKSTSRPGATRLSTEEELQRVIPVVEALSSTESLRQKGVCISIDTFDSVVASAAVAAGAHIVNDVSGGTLDPNMFDTVAKLEVPFILMHMRGDPKTMTSAENTTYDDVIRDVANELAAQAARAELAGIPAWQMMLDPGLGFAKTAEQSLEILRGLKRLRSELARNRASLGHAPLVLGPSRKRFLGRIAPLVKEAKDRDWASCAAAVACVANGADVVRMHNVRGGRDAVDVAHAVWGGKG